MSMNKEHLRTGDKATCVFRFIKNPEFLHPNARMVFREGRTKAIGNILRTIPYVPGGQPSVATNPSLKQKPSQAPKMQGKGRRGRGRKGHTQYSTEILHDHKVHTSQTPGMKANPDAVDTQ